MTLSPWLKCQVLVIWAMVIQSRNYGIIYWFIKRNFFQSIWISNYDKKASWCRYCYRYPISDPSNKTKIWRKKLQESVQSAQTALISKKSIYLDWFQHLCTLLFLHSKFHLLLLLTRIRSFVLKKDFFYFFVKIK